MKNIRRRSSNSFPNWCFGFRVASCCSPPAGRWKKSARRCLNTVSPLLLIQGALPKREILLRHKLRIDRGEPSIIFGMASFSEGVDLPGVYCNNVIIAKLPFSVPTDPVGQTLTEWLEKNGRDAFREISIPEACLKLTQSVGRLIRTESDTGAVTILDKRLKTKAYGKDILASLPPFRREIR